MIPLEELARMRQEYTTTPCDWSTFGIDPIRHCRGWLQEAIKNQLPEPNAMVLSTASPIGEPSARAVLLKDISKEGFYFFTHYTSDKGKILEKNPLASLLFLWIPMERQIRIEGHCARVAQAQSDAYFALRPRGAQLAAWASEQSQCLKSRAALEKAYQAVEERFSQEKTIPRPSNWGGYVLQPRRIEFWQGQANRLHARLCYQKTEGSNQWERFLLAP